ncbi:MAG: Riboflavin biosynthesis protein RibD [Pseudidiomarina mangrovi]|nr:MAG: Riboflavin biosynthesis protein RibD [Pseudidiomarina mangrovi]
MTNSDHAYMSRALQLAAQARFSAAPNPMVGCVIVKQQQVIGEGWHRRPGGHHAEVFALQQAGSDAHGATAYVTLEPCSHFGRTPPCANALIEAGIGKVVVAMQDPNPLVAGSGIERLRAAGIEVVVGLMAAEAEQLNRGFISRMRRNRPYLQVKLAASLDGATALANGASKWITGAEARADVHQHRAASQAVLSTAQTVLRDNAQLNVRFESPDESIPQPLRVILDRRAQLTPASALVRAFGGPILLVYGEHAQPVAQQWPAHVRWITLAEANDRLDLCQLMTHLAMHEQVNTVWTECGATLAGQLIQQQLADELIVYLAPKLLGAKAQPLLALPALTELNQATQLRFTEVEQLGEDIRLSAVIDYSNFVNQP